VTKKGKEKSFKKIIIKSFFAVELKWLKLDGGLRAPII
jgi:hypothetical protein